MEREDQAEAAERFLAAGEVLDRPPGLFRRHHRVRHALERVEGVDELQRRVPSHRKYAVDLPQSPVNLVERPQKLSLSSPAQFVQWHQLSLIITLHRRKSFLLPHESRNAAFVVTKYAKFVNETSTHCFHVYTWKSTHDLLELLEINQNVLVKRCKLVYVLMRTVKRKLVCNRLLDARELITNDLEDLSCLLEQIFWILNDMQLFLDVLDVVVH